MKKNYSESILNVGDCVVMRTYESGRMNTLKEDCLIVREKKQIRDYLFIEAYSVTNNNSITRLLSNEDCKFLFEKQFCGKRLGIMVEQFKLI